jgi:hypothetical protein
MSTEDVEWYELVLRNKDIWLLFLGSPVPPEMVAIAFFSSTALFVVPLTTALLSYHIYLICTGMTTYEHCKWRQWRGVISKGFAYTAPIIRHADERVTDSSKTSIWGNQATQFLVLTRDGKVPRRLPSQVTEKIGEQCTWSRVQKLSDLENVYNLGIVRNWKMLLKS